MRESSPRIRLFLYTTLPPLLTAATEGEGAVQALVAKKPWLGTFSGCLIHQPACVRLRLYPIPEKLIYPNSTLASLAHQERHPDAKTGYFLDNFEESGTNETRCLHRALEYHAWCGNYFVNRTVAVFLDTYGMEVFPPFGCAIFQRSCPMVQQQRQQQQQQQGSGGDSSYDGVWFDNFEGAFTNETKCLHRAAEYRAWCHAKDSPEWVSALYAPSAISSVVSEKIQVGDKDAEQTPKGAGEGGMEFNTTLRALWPVARSSNFATVAIPTALFELAGMYLDCRSPPMPFVDGMDPQANMHYNCNGPNAQLAVDALRLHLMANPGHVDAWYNQGVAHFRLTRLDSALKCFAAAARLSNGTHSFAVGAFATILTQQGRFADAWAVLDDRVRPKKRVGDKEGGAEGEEDENAMWTSGHGADEGKEDGDEDKVPEYISAPELVSWARLSHRFGATTDAVRLLRAFIVTHYEEHEYDEGAVATPDTDIVARREARTKRQAEEEEGEGDKAVTPLNARLSSFDLEQQEANLRFRLAWLLDLAGQKQQRKPYSRFCEESLSAPQSEAKEEGEEEEEEEEKEKKEVVEQEAKRGLGRFFPNMLGKNKKKSDGEHEGEEEERRRQQQQELVVKKGCGGWEKAEERSAEAEEEKNVEDFSRAAFEEHRRANQLVAAIDARRRDNARAAGREGTAADEPPSLTESLAQMAALRMAYCKDCVHSLIPSSNWLPGAKAGAAKGAIPLPIPVFVVGMPRSGTSLVEQMLSQHPGVAAAGEIPSLTSLSPRIFVKRASFFDDQKGSATSSSSSIIGATFDKSVTASHMDKLAKRFLDLLSRHARLDEDLTATAKVASTASAFSSASPPRLASSSPRFIVSKLPNHFELIGFIAKLFPGVPVIHCTRDARDTILSNYQTNYQQGHKWSYNLTEAADYYSGYRAIMRHWAAVFHDEENKAASGENKDQQVPLNMLSVRYEDVVCDPVAAAEQLVRFLKQWDLRGRDNHQKGPEKDPDDEGAVVAAMAQPHTSYRTAHTSSNEQVRRPIYKTSVGRWRQYSGVVGAVSNGYISDDPEELAAISGLFPAHAILERVLRYEPTAARDEARADLARDLPCGGSGSGGGEGISSGDDGGEEATQADARWSANSPTEYLRALT